MWFEDVTDGLQGDECSYSKGKYFSAYVGVVLISTMCGSKQKSSF